ncbi:MAG: polysaccharide deacetylase family protein [Vulcanimicrobiaceae bacterium]
MSTLRRSLSAPANAVARTALRPLPLAFWKAVFPKDVVALCYHAISDERLPHVRLYPYKTPQQFRDDLDSLDGRFVTYRELLEQRLRGAAPRRNAAFVTFDDGFAECFGVARTILLERRIDAAFFITTDFIDDRRLFFESALSLCIDRVEHAPSAQVADWLRRLQRARLGRDPASRALARSRLRDLGVRGSGRPARGRLIRRLMGLGAHNVAEIERACELIGIDGAPPPLERRRFVTAAQVRRLADDGFTVGAHGLGHRNLQGLSPREIEDEIVRCCTRVAELTNRARVPFAFPYSGLQVDRGFLGDLMQRHPVIELIFDSGGLRRDPPFVVNRVFADHPPRGSRSEIADLLRSSWTIPSAWHRGT